jgi:hypothetical protein
LAASATVLADDNPPSSAVFLKPMTRVDKEAALRQFTSSHAETWCRNTNSQWTKTCNEEGARKEMILAGETYQVSMFAPMFSAETGAEIQRKLVEIKISKPRAAEISTSIARQIRKPAPGTGVVAIAPGVVAFFMVSDDPESKTSGKKK